MRRISLDIFVLIIIGIFLALPVRAVTVDFDQDGLSDEVEQKLGTDPQNADSDGDSFKDGEEVMHGFNPLGVKGDRKVDRRVEVNLNQQQLYYFFNNVKVATMPVSTGLQKWATPVGEYKIFHKEPSRRYKGVGYDYKNTKWNLEFKSGFYLHGAYWHNEFGKRPMSHGCVNMAYKDVEKLYAALSVGDKVKVYGKTPVKVTQSVIQSGAKDPSIKATKSN